MLKKVILFGAAFAAAQFSTLQIMAEDIPVEIDFSIDEGKTYTPVADVASNSIVWARVSWADYIRPDGVRSEYHVSINSTESDFASANIGRQNWGGTAKWYQKVPPGYIQADKNMFIFKIDTALRYDDVIGYKNKWSRQESKYINGLLPFCPPLAEGVHNFTFNVYYWDKNKKKVEGKKDFQIIIDSTKKPAIERKFVKREYVSVPQKNLSADYILSVSNIVNLATGKHTGGTNILVRVRNDLQGWVIDENLPDQPYSLVWTVQSGTKSGMGFLDKHEPLIYLNGIPLSFDFSGPIQKQEGIFTSQIYSENRVHLKPGDHLRVSKSFIGGRIGTIRLYKSPVKKGKIRIRGFVAELNRQKMELNYKIISQNNETVKAEARLRNITNKEQEYQLSFTAKDYWQVIVKEKIKTISLAPYEMRKISFEFPLKDSFRYTSTVDVTDTETCLTVNQHSDAEVTGTEYRETVDIHHSVSNEFRSFKWLNNGWMVYDVTSSWNDPVAPAGAKGTKLTFPGIFYNNNNKPRLFTKDFSLENSFKDKKITVHFEGDGDEVQVWLNGKVVLKKQSMLATPFQIDLTDLVNVSGSNSLAFVAYPSKRLHLRDVFIEARPKQSIKDVFITPSFQKKNISLQIETENADGLTVSGSVSYLGNPQLQIPPQALESRTNKTVVSWADPVLWSPESPQLLRLHLVLKDDAGNVIDQKDIRFGFRELWVSGNELILNGAKRIFRAVAMNGGYTHDTVKDKATRDRLRRRKALGVCFLRHIYQGISYATIADEEGIMMAQGVITVAHSYASAENLQNDELWAEKDLLTKKIIRNLYNYPSVVEWYVSNEFSESKKGDSLKLARKRLIEANNVVRAMDPLRFIGNGCDLDLDGTKQRYSTHYPIDVGALRTIDAYTPDVCLWHYSDQPLTNGMMVPGGLVKGVANVHVRSPMAWGTKPIQVDEFGWNMFYNPPGGYLQLFGDSPIASVWEMKECHHRINAMFNAGHRDAEVALYVNWDHMENNAYRYVPKIDIQLWDQSHDWYTGSKVSIPYDIFNETLDKKDSVLRVTLENNSRNIDLYNSNITMDAMGIVRSTVDFTVPSVGTEESFKMHYVLSAGGKTIATEIVDVTIYPKNKDAIISDKKILVYDPTHLLDKIISNLALKTINIESLLELKAFPQQVLIVADNALNNAEDSGIRQIEDYVNAGGRVLVMQQKDVHGLLGMNTTAKISSIAFKRGYNQVEMQEFQNSDFKYWYKGHVVSRYDYQKPNKAVGMPLLDSGSGIGGLEYTPLFKMNAGKGICYLSQMNIIKDYYTAPAADKLFRTLLSQLIAFKPSDKKLGIYVEKDSSLAVLLKRIKVEINKDKNITDYDALFCDVNMLNDKGFKEKIVNYLKGNGTIYFKNIDFTNLKVLSEVLSIKISLAKNDLPFIRGRELIMLRDPILDGLSQVDFFWRRWLESESTYASFRTDKDLLYETSKFQIYTPTGISLLYPDSLVKLKVNNVVVYLDAVQWDSAPPVLKKQYSRIAKMILYNLGARFDEERVKPLDITKAEFEFVSLTDLFNRSMADKVDDDGKGSWNDQGPDTDTKAFPVGSQNFNGIPFVIKDGVNCVALHSKFRKSNLPKQVIIPVDKKVVGLSFLHTSAWTGPKIHGAYMVHYKDGTTAEIPLVGGMTLRDFSASMPSKAFPAGDGVKTKLAYTYKSEDGSMRSLFQVIWTNPYPGKDVDYIKFKTTENAIIALFAVTALVDDKNIVNAVAKSDPALAATFYNAGLEDYKAKKYDSAIVSFEKSINADINNYSSYLLMGDIYKTEKKYPAAEEILKKLINIAPNEIEAYTKLGEIYEVEGKKKEALDIYRKSFKIDKNQPWIMHAIERLKNEIK